MARIYQLMIQGEQRCGDIYYNEADAEDKAIQIVVDVKNPRWRSVMIWSAEEIDGVHIDALDWTPGKIIWA